MLVGIDLSQPKILNLLQHLHDHWYIVNLTILIEAATLSDNILLWMLRWLR